MTWLWIPITIAAALLQNIRTALQKHLKGRLSTNAATYTRYVFGFPLAIAYLLLLTAGFGLALPSPAQVRLVFQHWRIASLPSIAGVLGTICWLTAMTLQRVAYVRTLGLVELVFTFAISCWRSAKSRRATRSSASRSSSPASRWS